MSDELDPDRPSRRLRARDRPHAIPLSLVTRVVLHTVGWVLVAIGIAGLFLPGIQGILTAALGLAVVSVASKRVHGWLRERFRRWPKTWRRLEKFRRRLERRLRPKS